MIKLFLFLFLIDISLSQNATERSNIACGDYICYKSHGVCFGNGTTCICDEFYGTYPDDSSTMCNYAKKSQLLAFLLESIISFGAGHFYILNLSYAIPKFLIFAMGYTFFIALGILNKKREETDPTTLLISLAGCLSCVTMIIWQLVDMIMFGMNNYEDGNGIALYPW